MIPPEQRMLTRISDAELRRRWGAVRREMQARNIDVLVLQSSNDWLGGYVKWFTDLPATNGYPRTVLFHAVEPMTIIEMGPVGGRRDLAGQDDFQRGVGEVLHTPSFRSVVYTHADDADLATRALKRHGCRTIGMVGAGALPHAFVTRLQSALAGAVFIDSTDVVDRLKAVKSAEEIGLIRRAADLQDKVFSAVLDYMRPGLRDIDITSFAQAVGQRLGSEQGIFLGGSAPLGVRSPFMPRYLQGRALTNGDHLSLLIEVNGPGGFYTEIARTIVLGKASNELQDAFETMREAQAYSLSLMKPGTSCADIHRAHNAYMEQRGLPPELRLYAHGQGYDMVERPLIRADETMTIEAGMNIAVHPGYETPSVFAVVCDNYLIGDDGPGTCLHNTRQQIFEV